MLKDVLPVRPKSVAGFGFCFLLSGCSVLWIDSAPVQDKQVEQAAEQALKPQVAETSWVELMWQVPPNNPAERVEKYHINYGDKPGNLSNHDELKVSELTVIYHPKFGKVYQYRIDNIPATQPVYISLQAENRAGISQPTAVIRMEPGESKPLE